MTPIREQIITAFAARMGIIQKRFGFNTDAGLNVFRSRRDVDEDRIPAVVIFPQQEETNPNYGTNALTLPIRVEMIAPRPMDRAEEVKLVELMLADMIEATLAIEFLYSFTVGQLEPGPGVKIIGAVSGATAVVQTATLTGGTWAGGDAAGSITIRRKIGAFQAESIETENGDTIAAIAADPTSAQGPKDLTAGGLARDISYQGGGPEAYPDSQDTTVAVMALFHIIYVIAHGNPYGQTR